MVLGWSYGLDGELAKAPKYDDLDGFDKGQNGLFPIHVHIDKLGFIWVNFDAAETPEIPWNEDFEGIDTQSRLMGFEMDKYHFDHQWEIDGDYNWKTLADNYNEVRMMETLLSADSDLICICSATIVQLAILR